MAIPSTFSPSSPSRADCKCCGTSSPLLGVVDFNKNCNHKEPNLLPVCGIPVYYHRCPKCGFIFTVAFDRFSKEDFAAVVYNKGYAAVDPEYKEIRPTGSAGVIVKMFGGSPKISILDYGGGNGLLAQKLRSAGFSDVATYDPFVPEFSNRPDRKFDLIVSFEVMEHTPTPVETLADMDSLLDPAGMLMFSTLLQPPEIANVGLSWWYAAPRNGHVSLYTQEALAALTRARRMSLGSFTPNLHTASRTMPAYARHLMSPPPPACQTPVPRYTCAA